MGTKRAKKHKELVKSEKFIKREMRLDDRDDTDLVRAPVRIIHWLRRKGFQYISYDSFNYLWYLKDERPKVIPSLERLKEQSNNEKEG